MVCRGLEALSRKDGAWYDVDCHRSGMVNTPEGPRIRVRFKEYPIDEEEFYDIQELDTLFRLRSRPVEGYQCKELEEGSSVCAMAIFHSTDECKWIDAKILSSRHLAHPEDECTCEFKIKWTKYDYPSARIPKPRWLRTNNICFVHDMTAHLTHPFIIRWKRAILCQNTPEPSRRSRAARQVEEINSCVDTGLKSLGNVIEKRRTRSGNDKDLDGGGKNERNVRQKKRAEKVSPVHEGNARKVEAGKKLEGGCLEASKNVEENKEDAVVGENETEVAKSVLTDSVGSRHSQKTREVSLEEQRNETQEKQQHASESGKVGAEMDGRNGGKPPNTTSGKLAVSNGVKVKNNFVRRMKSPRKPNRRKQVPADASNKDPNGGNGVRTRRARRPPSRLVDCPVYANQKARNVKRPGQRDAGFGGGLDFGVIPRKPRSARVPRQAQNLDQMDQGRDLMHISAQLNGNGCGNGMSARKGGVFCARDMTIEYIRFLKTNEWKHVTAVLEDRLLTNREGSAGISAPKPERRSHARGGKRSWVEAAAALWNDLNTLSWMKGRDRVDRRPRTPSDHQMFDDFHDPCWAGKCAADPGMDIDGVDGYPSQMCSTVPVHNGGFHLVNSDDVPSQRSTQTLEDWLDKPCVRDAQNVTNVHENAMLDRMACGPCLNGKCEDEMEGITVNVVDGSVRIETEGGHTARDSNGVFKLGNTGGQRHCPVVQDIRCGNSGRLDMLCKAAETFMAEEQQVFRETLRK